MNKTWLIIKREYLTRVRKKTFLLSTFLFPLFFAVVIAAVVYFTIRNTRHEKVAVVDQSGILKANLENNSTVSYEFRSDVDTSNFSARGYSVLLLSPHTGINQTNNFKLISEGSLSRIANDQIRKDITQAMENNVISDSLKIDPKKIEALKKRSEQIEVDPVKKSELAKGTRNNFDLYSSIGYVTAFLIYITLFVYGVMVMRGVMEEKTNRIAEVMVSSVKPFQLMLGKIIGIGAVGLTQFLLWILLIGVFATVASSVISHNVMEQVGNASTQMPGSSAQTSQAIQNIAKAKATLSSVNWPLVVGCFIFYFLGGFLFYASLFAAVGSAVNEDPQDAQSLTLPITLPIVLGILIMINSINDPQSSLATWSSIIPFFSPIVMMSRIPFGVPDTVPYWQLGLSMLLLILGFLGTTWLSAKIYRTGILLYGKKPTWKEMIKWVGR